MFLIISRRIIGNNGLRIYAIRTESREGEAIPITASAGGNEDGFAFSALRPYGVNPQPVISYDAARDDQE
ncbi:MAG: hypothetical protein NUW21_07010, partial [Elusimicrobia bacterium]|nr:hypothetical protein [Elusimicrobiota bacterium]